MSEIRRRSCWATMTLSLMSGVIACYTFAGCRGFTHRENQPGFSQPQLASRRPSIAPRPECSGVAGDSVAESLLRTGNCALVDAVNSVDWVTMESFISKARTAFNEALDKDKTLYKAFFGITFLEVILGDLQSAEKSARAAVKLVESPEVRVTNITDKEFARNSLALVLWQQNPNSSEARNLFDQDFRFLRSVVESIMFRWNKLGSGPDRKIEQELKIFLNLTPKASDGIDGTWGFMVESRSGKQFIFFNTDQERQCLVQAITATTNLMLKIGNNPPQFGQCEQAREVVCFRLNLGTVAHKDLGTGIGCDQSGY